MPKLALCIPAHPDCRPDLLNLPNHPDLDRNGILHLPCNPGYFGAWPRVHPKWGPHNGGTYHAGSLRLHVESLMNDIPKRIPEGYEGIICLDVEHIDFSDRQKASEWTKIAVDLIRERCPKARLAQYVGKNSVENAGIGFKMQSLYARDPVKPDNLMVHAEANKQSLIASRNIPILWGQHHDTLGPAEYRSTPVPTHRLVMAAAAACASLSGVIGLWAPCRTDEERRSTERATQIILETIETPRPLPMLAVPVDNQKENNVNRTD